MMANRHASKLTRTNLGFLLAKALQRWNELLYAGFRREGFAHVRPSFGSVLIPLFEEDGLRLGELARRVNLSKQTMTTMVRLVEKAGLVTRRADADDRRATRVYLGGEAKRFRPVAEKVLGKLERRAKDIKGKQHLNQVRDWLKRFAQM
jgi:DNA-binding MarR family transcriptional regulator